MTTIILLCWTTFWILECWKFVICKNQNLRKKIVLSAFTTTSLYPIQAIRSCKQGACIFYQKSSYRWRKWRTNNLGIKRPTRHRSPKWYNKIYTSRYHKGIKKGIHDDNASSIPSLKKPHKGITRWPQFQIVMNFLSHWLNWESR